MEKSETLSETRQKFEEWAKGKGISLKRRPDGEYYYDSTSNIFLGWQAGRLQGLEEAQLIALEQRCERETPWDLACQAVAAAIREKANG